MILKPWMTIQQFKWVSEEQFCFLNRFSMTDGPSWRSMALWCCLGWVAGGFGSQQVKVFFTLLDLLEPGDPIFQLTILFELRRRNFSHAYPDISVLLNPGIYTVYISACVSLKLYVHNHGSKPVFTLLSRVYAQNHSDFVLGSGDF